MFLRMVYLVMRMTRVINSNRFSISQYMFPWMVEIMLRMSWVSHGDLSSVR